MFLREYHQWQEMEKEARRQTPKKLHETLMRYQFHQQQPHLTRFLNRMTDPSLPSKDEATIAKYTLLEQS
jgi:hypothetical protein